jgi:hypothetical protein
MNVRQLGVRLVLASLGNFRNAKPLGYLDPPHEVSSSHRWQAPIRRAFDHAKILEDDFTYKRTGRRPQYS